MITGLVSGVQHPGFLAPLMRYVIAATYWISLSLSVLICKMGFFVEIR